MSWTISDDNDVLHVRASIATAEELDKVIGALERKRAKFAATICFDEKIIKPQESKNE